MGITASPGAGNGAATAGSAPAGLVSVSPIVPDDDGDQCKLVHRIAPVLYPVRYFDGYVVSDFQCVYRCPVHCVYVP
jgi:hypothetical protein